MAAAAIKATLAAGVLLATATPASAEPNEADVAKVPAMVASICKTPIGWVLAEGDHVRLAMTDTTRPEQADCIIGVLRRPELNLSFASEGDAAPDTKLADPIRYVAHGWSENLRKLAAAARASGFVVGPIRDAKDGVSDMPVEAPAGMTIGEAAALEAAVTDQEYGDTRLDPAPPPPAK